MFPGAKRAKSRGERMRQIISNRTRNSSSNQRRSKLNLASSGGEKGVTASPIPAEIVATRPMVGLEMAVHGFDGSSASHLAANDFCDAADMAANPDPELVGMVVAAIALSPWMRRTATRVTFRDQ
jgi:hypothetical protein